MKSKINIPHKEEFLQESNTIRPGTTHTSLNPNLFNFNTLQARLENNFFSNESSICGASPILEETSKLLNEGGEQSSLDPRSPCVDTQTLLSFDSPEAQPKPKAEESKEEDICLSLSSDQLLCLDLPPKTIKALDETLQNLKALNINRAKLLASSPDKRERALSRELYQCSRNVRIGKNGKPNYWRCRRVKDCHICQYFDQQEKLKIFKSNLLRNRYAPHQWKLVTLTLPRTYAPNEIRRAIKELNSNFTKLTRRKAWRDSVEGGIKSIEWPRSKEDPRRYRPHIHLLLAVNDSFSSNKLFQKTRKSLEKLKADPGTKETEIHFNLSFVWGRYFKKKLVHTHIRDLRKLNSTSMDLSWLKPSQIDPDEITYTALEYITKVIQKDCSSSESPTPSLTTSTIIHQVKGLRRISTFGSLQGYLTKPKRRKRSESEKQALIDTMRSENIHSTYQYNSESRIYEKVDILKPHFESWLLFRDRSIRLRSSCSSADYSPPEVIPLQLENPIRCKNLAKENQRE
jgi:plasmid rolling circle replication initiator protein Rep